MGTFNNEMRFILSVNILILLFLLVPGHRKHRKSGLCLSTSEVALSCSAGTPFGEKLAEALKNCSLQNSVNSPNKLGYTGSKKERQDHHYRGRRSNRRFLSGGERRRYGFRRCPSADRLVKKLEDKLEETKCVSTEMGWSDGTNEENLAAITQDLMTLPGNMSTIILESAQECTKQKIEKWNQKLERCSASYDAEESASIQMFINTSSSANCLSKSLVTVCSDFVKSKLMNMTGQTTMSK